MNVEIMTNQILAFMERDESFEQVVAGSRMADPGERLIAAERLAIHLVEKVNGERPGGYHAVGHSVLDYWTSWEKDHPTGDLALLGARIVRDVKLLAGLLDVKVGFEQLLLEAIQGLDPKVRRPCTFTRGCTLDPGHSEPCLSADAKG